MQKLLLLGICTLVSTISFSQVVIANEKMNIVYAAVDNPIQFSANGYNIKNLYLRASCGHLTKTTEGYTWKLCHEKYSRVTFSCFYKDHGKSIFISSKDYRIKNPPSPTINFGPTLSERENSHLRLRTIKLEEIKFGPRVFIENFDFEIIYNVKGYDIELCKTNGDTLLLKNIGQAFNDTNIQEIKKLKEGDKLWIRNIIVFNDCELAERKLEEAKCLEF